MPAGEEARQTAFENVPVPGYTCRADICAQALTLQLPLEGKLLRGGVTAVIKTADGQWIHCQQHGAAPDFFISTREVCAPQNRAPDSQTCGEGLPFKNTHHLILDLHRHSQHVPYMTKRQ